MLGSFQHTNFLTKKDNTSLFTLQEKSFVGQKIFSGMKERISERFRFLGYWNISKDKPDVMRFCEQFRYRPQDVYAWLDGRIPKEETIDDLSKHLGVTVEWLLLGVETITAEDSLTPESAESSQSEVKLLPALKRIVESLTLEEQREAVQVAPLLIRILRASKSGDKSAAKSWEWIRGNILMFNRAIDYADQPPVLSKKPHAAEIRKSKIERIHGKPRHRRIPDGLTGQEEGREVV